MKIDLGKFGLDIPQGGRGNLPPPPAMPPPPAVPTQAFVTQGLPEFGAAGLKIGAELAQAQAQDLQLEAAEAHRKRLEAEAEAKLIAREAKRAEAMTIHAKAQNALAEAGDRIRRGVADGTIKVDAAPILWTEESQKIVETHLKTVDKENVELVRAGLAGNVGHMGRELNGAIVDRNRSEIGAKLVDYLEQMQRLGISDPATAKKQGAMAIEAQAPLAGHKPEQVAKMRHTFIEGVTFNHLHNTLVQIKNNRGALDAFVKRLGDEQDLDPGKKNILLNQANASIMHLENKAIAAENRRLTQLQRVGAQLEQRIAMGVPMNPADLESYMRAAKGTVFEDVANGLVEEQAAVTELLKKTPAEQAAAVSKMREDMVNNGRGNPRIVKRLEQTVNNTITMLRNNSMQYAIERGGAKIEPLDLSKPDTWQANLANRAQVLDAQHAKLGGGRGALFPREAEMLAQVMATGTPEQKKAYLEPLRRGLAIEGARDPDAVFRATIQQIAHDSPTTALFASIATKETPIKVGTFFPESYRPGDTSALGLRGAFLLNPPKGAKGEDGKSRGFQMPKGDDEKAMVTLFNDAVGDVFADNFQTYNVQLQAAREVYAALTEKKNGGGAPELDSTAWKEAINRTLPIVKFNSKPVLAPYGMEAGAFKDRVRDDLPRAIKAAGLPGEFATNPMNWRRFTLQNETGSTYFVRQGTEYLTGPNGRVVVKVRPLRDKPLITRDAQGNVYSDGVPQ